MVDENLDREPVFHPLLEIGRHALSLDELRELCVARFPISKSRPTIMEGLEKFTSILNDYDIEGEIWVNGSFMTSKIDPNDVDVIVRMTSDFMDHVTDEQYIVIEWIDSDIPYLELKCDSYSYIEYPDGHPDYWKGEYMYAYWMRQWGFDREDGMKGIAVIRLGGSGE